MQTTNIKELISWLQQRVSLQNQSGVVSIAFNTPEVNDFKKAQFTSETMDLTLHAPWWHEMVTDIIETPDFAAPNENPERILQYAHDVVEEYIRKRLNP